MVHGANTIDEYISLLPETAQGLAREIRFAIKRAAPDAIEAIRYNMPAFGIGGATLIYFAVWKNHVGFYPIYRGNKAFEDRIAAFRTKTDTVQFKLNAPMLFDLIEEIVRSQRKKLHSQ